MLTAEKVWVVNLAEVLHDSQRIANCVSRCVCQVWHLREAAAQLLLGMKLLLVINSQIREQISNGLSLSSDVEVAEEWLVELVWAILNTTGAAL